MNPNHEEIRIANENRVELWKDHLDLVVPLAIELGRTKLTASAILELEPHAIVQLSRSTGEGVDVLADSQRIARGEIVMIEDRTGIRINEISELHR
jgi:flagellar motor switch protein FliN/FliY